MHKQNDGILSNKWTSQKTGFLSKAYTKIRCARKLVFGRSEAVRKRYFVYVWL